MLLFLMGIGLFEVVLLFLLLLGCGLFIFWLTKKILRKTLKGASDRQIKLFSGISAFILSPVLVIGSLAVFIYIAMQNTPESDEAFEKNHYSMMQESVQDNLKTGMTKTEVVEILGETDTTQSILVYDLSLPKAKEKYILEITFDKDGLRDFKRQP